jgi:hypothetical protein
MKRLEDLPLSHRLLVATAIVVLTLLVVTAIAPSDAGAVIEQRDVYAGITPDAKLLALDKQALDDAYREQLHHLFGVWLKGQARSSTEITTGLGIARRAYTTAAAQIAKREQEQHR